MWQRERQSQRCDSETERVPKGSKMERKTVTVKDKTKTEGSVSERQEDKSPGRQLLAVAS